MTKPLHGAKFDNFHQQIMNLPAAAQLMMTAVLPCHNIASKTFISHNCFIIIVFLYPQKLFALQLHYFTSLQYCHSLTWPTKIHYYGRDWV